MIRGIAAATVLAGLLLGAQRKGVLPSSLRHSFGKFGGGCRREEDVPVRPPRQLGLDRRRLVDGVAVHDDVDVQPLRDASVDRIEELPGPVAAVALARSAASLLAPTMSMCARPHYGIC